MRRWIAGRRGVAGCFRTAGVAFALSVAVACAGAGAAGAAGYQPWGWGYNGEGQLGDGTTADRSVPVAVSGLTSATAVVAGQYHSVALLAGGASGGLGLEQLW